MDVKNNKNQSVLRLKNSLNPKKRAGIGAKINTAINICQFYVETYKDVNLNIEDSELELLFNFPLNRTYAGKVRDINHEYAASNPLNPSNAHSLADMKLICGKRKIYDQFFVLKDHEKFSALKDIFVDESTCALQIRGTDKYTEVPPPNIENIVSKVNYVLNNGAKSVFLATDDLFYLEILRREFGTIIKWNEMHEISRNGKPLHTRFRRNDLNKQMLEDAYLLSKCSWFLYAFSNVSYFALTMGAGDFLYLDSIHT